MKNWIASLTFLLFAIGALQAQNEKLITDFDDLMYHLKKGKSIQAVLHYAKCDLYVDSMKQERTINAIGGMPIEVYEYFGKNLFGNEHAFISTSETKLIENPLGEGYVYNYVKMKIYDNNQVDIFARYLNPKTYKETMSEKFVGQIHSKDNDGGIFLYSR